MLTHLKPPHIPGIAGVFQTILITLQKKLQEKPRKQNMSVNYYIINKQLQIFYWISYLSSRLPATKF